MSRTHLRLGALAAAIALGVAAPAAAAADDARSKSHSVEVEYGDLNLATAAGAEAVLDRIERAAQKACGYVSLFDPLPRQRAHRACVSDAVARAVAGLDAPAVRAAHLERSDVSHDLASAAR